jgi:serine/alanine adding enzyme
MGRRGAGVIAEPGFSIDTVRQASGDWDGFVRGQPGWTHFHLLGWKSVMERALGHECVYLTARAADGSLCGVLPLVRVRSRLFGHYLVSMPFLNYGGPLGSPEAVRALAEMALALANESGVRLLELRSRRELPLALPASHHKITVLLDLPVGDPSPLWDGLKAKVRSQVRRPQKEGVEVRFGLEQERAFYTVFARHMRDLGTPVLAHELFETIGSTFPDDVWYGCAWLKDAPIAAGCGFRWGDEFEMTWASALRQYNPIAPNMLLYWRFMERCIELGVRVFNFGRCTPGGGTHQFKRQWGGRDEQLWWYRGGAAAEVGTPSPGDGAYAWGPKVWRHLPLGLANALGPRIVRYIP